MAEAWDSLAGLGVYKEGALCACAPPAGIRSPHGGRDHLLNVLI